MSRKTTQENREAILVQAFLTCPGITAVSEKTGIPRSTVYKVVNTDSFQEKLAEAKQKAVDDAVSYLQGNLTECSQVLMEIVRDRDAAPQVRINAANAVFQNVKGFSKENTSVVAGMAVKIVDSL